MNSTISRFKKVRTISQVLEDAFSFLQLHFIKMIKMIWEINKVYILLFTVFSLFYYYRYSEFLTDIFLKDNLSGNGNNILMTFIFTLFTIFITARIYSSGYGYIKSYLNNDGEVKLEEVKNFTENKWIGYIVISFLAAILIMIGFLLLIFPGIWLLAPIALVFPVYFIEDRGIIDSFQRAFSLVSGKWWYTFGVLFLTFLIIMILNTVISVPITTYTMIKIISAAKEHAGPAMNSNGDIIFSILTVFNALGKMLISLVQIPVMVFLYFSLKEYHTAEGALEKIQEIGKEN
jgi:hypothetical protein